MPYYSSETLSDFSTHLDISSVCNVDTAQAKVNAKYFTELFLDHSKDSTVSFSFTLNMKTFAMFVRLLIKIKFYEYASCSQPQTYTWLYHGKKGSKLNCTRKNVVARRTRSHHLGTLQGVGWRETQSTKEEQDRKCVFPSQDSWKQ